MAESKSAYPILDESDQNGEEFIHRTCGMTILGKRVTHPIWYKGMTAAGGGEVQIEIVPFCPKCEPAPNPHGDPIYI